MTQPPQIELRATVLRERKRFSNARENVLILDCKGEKSNTLAVKGPEAPEKPLSRGMTFVFFGNWRTYKNPYSGRSEPQFEFKNYSVSKPEGEDAIIGYLRNCPGVGPMIARRIWDHCGTESLDVLRNHPVEMASSILGLSTPGAVEAANWIAQNHHNEKITLALQGLVGGRGFRKNLVDELIKRLGHDGPEVIRKDAFVLLGFTGCGFKGVDKLFLDLGGDPNSLSRQRHCLVYGLQRCGSGDVWFEVAEGEKILRNNLPGVAIDYQKALDWCVGMGAIATRKDSGESWIALKKNADNENSIATILSHPPIDATWCRQRPQDISDHQWRVLQEATSRGRIGILGGGPGTGKTHVVCEMIRQIASEHGRSTRILSCAPTGKAAVRLTEKLLESGSDVKATTVHRMLGVATHDDGESWCFTFNSGCRLECDYIFCDEASMLDNSLANSILQALPPHAKLLLIGDVNQLPPVGVGAPLRDMIDAGMPYGELTEIRRNSGDIVKACHAIINKTDWHPAPEWDIRPESNLRLLNVDVNFSTTIYGAIQESASKCFDILRNIQVICPCNERGDVSRVKLNEMLAPKLNPLPFGDKPFRMDEKVINTSNSWMPPVGVQLPGAVLNQHGEVYVANGEMGRVSELHNGFCEIDLESPSRKVKGFYVNTPWQLAYAISCHKSQGSEFPVSIVVLDGSHPASRVSDRAWLYTAISRAKKLCVLVGDMRVANAMCRRSYMYERKTFLRQKLQKLHAQINEAT